MAEEETKHEEHKEEEHKEEHGKHGEKGGKEHNKKLLWWGLGIGAAGLVATIFLMNKSNQDQSGQAASTLAPSVNGVTPGQGSTISDQSADGDYWPYINGTGSGTSSVPPAPEADTDDTSSGGGSGGKKKKPPKKTGGGSGSHTGGSSGSGSHGKGPNPHGYKVTPNPHAGGAHGWIYTAHGGENIQNLFDKAWPGQNQSFGWNYANNAQLLKHGQSMLKPGQKVIL